MILSTRDLLDLAVIRSIIKEKHSVIAFTDDGSKIRITLAKNAPQELDSWIGADEVFDVFGENGKMMITELDTLEIR